MAVHCMPARSHFRLCLGVSQLCIWLAISHTDMRVGSQTWVWHLRPLHMDLVQRTNSCVTLAKSCTMQWSCLYPQSRLITDGIKWDWHYSIWFVCLHAAFTLILSASSFLSLHLKLNHWFHRAISLAYIWRDQRVKPQPFNPRILSIRYKHVHCSCSRSLHYISAAVPSSSSERIFYEG